MGLRNRREPPEIPEIEITPMLNVIVVVLAFFVVVSTTLSGEPDSVDVKVPDKSQPQDAPEPEVEEAEPPPNLEVKVDEGGTLTADDSPIDRGELLNKLPAFLENNPESQVYLIPDPNLPYEQVIQLLDEMRETGGDRVVLAIRSRSQTEPTAAED